MLVVRGALLFSLLFLLCCTNTNKATHTDDGKPAIARDTVTNLSGSADSVFVFKAPNGRFYTVINDETEPAFSARKFDCTEDGFYGVTRKAAKTSIAKGNSKGYVNLKNFLKQLVADSIMEKNRNITSAPDNNRVVEEERNVKLSKVLMFAIKREDDNDYHVIIGDGNGLYFTVEVSGLPAAGTTFYDRLVKPRDAVKAFVGSTCLGSYKKFLQGVPVEISGSLFFDVDHDAGSVGPAGMRPATAWEIHPVTSITFKKYL